MIGDPLWHKNFVWDVHRHPIVRKVNIQDNLRVRVVFKTGLYHNFTPYTDRLKLYYNSSLLQKKDCDLQKLITVEDEFPLRPFATPEEKKQNSKYFRVPRARLHNINPVQKQFLIHELTYRILNMGYYTYPWSIDKLHNILTDIDNITNPYMSGNFCSFRPKIGSDILDHYFPIVDLSRRVSHKIRCLRGGFTIPRLIYYILIKLIDRSQKDITLDTYTKSLRHHGHGPKINSPATYKAIFQQLFKSIDNRTIVDPHPYLGSKALGIKLTGAKYSVLGDHNYFNHAVNNGFCSDLGLDYNPSPSPPYDILSLDNDFKPLDLQTAINYRRQTRDMLLYVHRDQLYEFRDVLPPQRITKVRTGVKKTSIDYLFTYHG